MMDQQYTVLFEICGRYTYLEKTENNQLVGNPPTKFEIQPKSSLEDIPKLFWFGHIYERLTDSFQHNKCTHN